MIVDTGVFVAASNADEPYHESCAALLQSASGRLVVPALVVAETTYLIEQAKGPAGRGSVPGRWTAPGESWCVQ